MQLFDLTGKRAIVTGASRGLGHAMAEGLMEAGAEVVLMGRMPQTEEAAKTFRKRGFRCHAIEADMADLHSLPDAFERALDALGGELDILLPAAGIQKRHPSEQFPMEDWQAVMDVNLHAVFLLNQLAARVMIPRGWGKIINVASMLSFFGGLTVPAYAASKGGVAQMTKALANEWAAKGIGVNAVAPGYFATDMNTALMGDPGRSEEIIRRIPAGRWGQPEDMKGIAVFLASHASDYIHGAILPVDGGYLGR